MEEKDVVIHIATDWTPAQAQKAFDEQLGVQVQLAGEARTFVVAGFRQVDDDIRAELYLCGTLMVDVGEAPEVETRHDSPI